MREVWELVGDPSRHPEWWPTSVETECSHLAQGCSYRSVVKGKFGFKEEHELVVDELDDCHCIKISCPEVGMFTNFLLTEARGGTFVDAEFGSTAEGLSGRFVESPVGRLMLRRWLKESLTALQGAVESQAPVSR